MKRAIGNNNMRASRRHRAAFPLSRNDVVYPERSNRSGCQGFAIKDADVLVTRERLNPESCCAPSVTDARLEVSPARREIGG